MCDGNEETEEDCNQKSKTLGLKMRGEREGDCHLKKLFTFKQGGRVLMTSRIFEISVLRM